jgi:tRNA A-37 threonylcarbamoyl transferase component Bud32
LSFLDRPGQTGTAQYRRRSLDAELARVRRDAELQVTGQLARAGAQAQDVRDEAQREATAALDAARAEVDGLQRRRDELATELLDLSRRLAAAVQRLGLPPAGLVGPLIG